MSIEVIKFEFLGKKNDDSTNRLQAYANRLLKERRGK